MRHSTKLGVALVTVGVLALSACGKSTAKLLDSSTTKTKNAALDDNSGLNAKGLTFNREALDGWESHEWGVGLEDQIVRDESKLTACPEGTPTKVDTIDDGSLHAIQNACQPEFLVVHYTGFITAPGTAGEDVNVKFKVAKDDTFFMTVGGNTVVDDWHNSGCQWAEGTATLKAGQKYPLDAWFSQFRGGICNQMTWSINDGDFEIVPASALSRVDDTPAATTTTVAEATTTTVAEQTASKEVVTTTTVAEGTASENAVATTAPAPSDTMAPGSAGTSDSTVTSDTSAATSDTMAATDSTVASGTAASEDTTGTGNSGSSSNNIWWLLILLVIILGGGGYAYSRKKK